MKRGGELYGWAQEAAIKACREDTGLIGVVGYKATTVAIMAAYMQGGIDALADEIAHMQSQGAISQADGSAV